MSDSRFHLNVTFEVYGREFKWYTSLNWTASPGECDERIINWFVDNYDNAYDDFQAALLIEKTESHKRTEELAEREQLARLLKKYPLL
jgi:hypothetical protein